MKKLISVILAFMLLAVVLTGCGSKPAAEPSSGDASAPKLTEAEEKKAAEDLEKALEAISTKGWPKDKLPAELPEYTEGEIVNSGGDSETFYVKIDKTTKEALSNYLGKLKEAGWYVDEGSESEASKGIYSIRFTWQRDDYIQMALYTSEVGAWPKDELPPEVIPPENCTFIGDMELIENIEGQAWYFTYQCDGIDEEEAYAYMDMLVKNGWSGDRSMVTKDIEWKGKKYEASIEIYEILDNSSGFTLNLMLVQ